jgi:hypothetical protein
MEMAVTLEIKGVIQQALGANSQVERPQFMVA